MKLLFLLLVSGAALGQTVSDSIWNKNILENNYPPGASCAVYRGDLINPRLFQSCRDIEKPFTDTVRCIMVCSDTLEVLPKNVYAIYDRDGTWHPGLLLIWQRGFEVRRHYWPSHPSYSIFSEEMSVELVGYLDEKKKPLKYLVWLSKQTNNE